MSFADKLFKMVESAEPAAEKALESKVSHLGELIGRAIMQVGGCPVLNKGETRELAEDLFYAKQAARTLDAAQFLNEKVLVAANGRVVDVRLDRDLRKTQQSILNAFETGEAPRRGFVYVAWRKSPLRFLYVGKASSTDRMNLASHGKLARASADATLLGLLFPAQSNAEIIAALEASVIELVTEVTGAPPELNDRVEKVPRGDGRTDLDDLAGFLERIARDLRRPK